MKVSIHQPSYFPWLGLLDKINSSDIFVILDTVQLNDNAYQSRNIFLNHNGNVEYLGIPFGKKDYQSKMIKDLKTIDKRWQKKHNGFIIANYKKHPFFDEIYPFLDVIYQKDYIYLIDILMDSMEVCNKIFDLKTKSILASDLNLDNILKKDDLVLDILRKTNATSYLSGIGARAYQKNEKFELNNIKLEYQFFKHPNYEQKNSKKFELGLSSIDMAFNIGIEESINILRSW